MCPAQLPVNPTPMPKQDDLVLPPPVPDKLIVTLTEPERLGERYLLAHGQRVNTPEGSVIRVVQGTGVNATTTDFRFNRTTNRWEWYDDSDETWSNTDTNPFENPTKTGQVRINAMGALLARLQGDTLAAARTELNSQLRYMEDMQRYLGAHAHTETIGGETIYVMRNASETYDVRFRWNRERSRMEWTFGVHSGGRLGMLEWSNLGVRPTGENFVRYDNPSIRGLLTVLTRVERASRDFEFEESTRTRANAALSRHTTLVDGVTQAGTEQPSTSQRRIWTFPETNTQVAYNRITSYWEFRTNSTATWRPITNPGTQLPKQLRALSFESANH